ncbi:MAG: amino acid ABC transporter permease [Bacillota bacterium]|nr:amino acid ABC transporter permease [Bacillota bacterium]
MKFAKILPYMGMFQNGVIMTLKYTALSLVLGIILGLLIGIVKLSDGKVCKIFKPVTYAFTAIFRGVPLMVMLYLVFYATPQVLGFPLSALGAGVAVFGLNTAAMTSEVFRAGIVSVPRGQTEAAIALGVQKRQAMMDIVIPQALKSILPAIVNESISLLKTTSLISVLGVADIMRTSNLVLAQTYTAFEPFIFAAVIYFILVYILTFFANMLERGLRKGD